MHIGILGIGGIGGFLAATLSKEHNVTCITSKETIDFIKNGKLKFISQSFGNSTINTNACCNLNKPLDILFITTKNQYLKESVKRIPEMHIKNCMIIPLLNGVSHRDFLKEIFRDLLVTGNIGSIEVEKTLNNISHISNKLKPMIELASSNGSLNIRLKSICKILESVGIKTLISEEESYVTWSKLVRLDAISSFSAAYDMSVGELRSDTFIRTQMIDYIDETIRVASIEGYFTSSAIVMEQIDKLPHELKTSLQKDIKEKRESELDSITGGIMDLALKNNINIPNHNLIYNMIKSKN